MNDSSAYTCPCSKSELDIFTVPPVNMGMEAGETVIHHPISTLADNSPIEFTIPGSPSDYIDLSKTLLTVKVKLCKLDNSNLALDAKVSTCNLLLHSLFSQVDVKLNDRLVTPSTGTYPYKSYLETLLSHGNESKDSWLQSELWANDSGEIDSNDPTDEDSNPGLIARYNRLKASAPIQLSGRPHVDIFQQERYLISGVRMDVKLSRANRNFYLMSPDASAAKLVIMDATLHIRRVRINPTIALAHSKTLDQGKNAMYPIRRGVVTSFLVPSGTLSINRENVITGQLPRRVIVGLVPNSAYNGNCTQNPFYFSHCQLNHLTLSSGGQNHPSSALKPDYNANLYTEAFTMMYSNCGLLNTDRGLDISMDDFKNGSTLYVFDLTADQDVDGAHVDPIKYGNIRLEAHFARQLRDAHNVLVYGEYQNLIQVDRARNILADFGSS